MKKILLAEEKGRFVRLFLNFVEERKDDSCVETISVRGTAWKQINFGKYDAVVHCAGMIGDKGSTYEEYYKINVELTRDIYNHCRSSGVKQFIYLSSMAVYDGIGWGFGKDGIIVEDTKPKQISYYGKSKYEAERILQNEDSEMKVAIIRAPSIVGKSMENYFES
ncbi:hypothetical protein JCM17039_03510 [Blautia glucerasea]